MKEQVKKFKHLNEDELLFIKDKYEDLGPKECARVLNKTIRYMERVGYILGLKTKPEARKAALIKSLDKPFDQRRVNPGLFLDVEMPEVAYYLGFLWADGNLNTHCTSQDVRLCINSSDTDNLLQVCSRIGDFTIAKTDYSYRNSRTCIRTNNRPLVDFLTSMDYGVKSWTSADKILSHIPLHLRHYWWRGLVDGDGCFSVNGKKKHKNKFMAISSGKEQDWTYVQELFRELGITKHKIHIRQNHKGWTSQIKIHNTDELVRFGEYIYQGYEEDKIGLKRKRDKYKEIKSIADSRTGRWPK